MTLDDAPMPAGPAGREDLASELYDALRDLARSAIRRAPGQLDPTDVLHQAWVRLAGSCDDMPRLDFLALCSTVMRRIVVDEARRRGSQRHAPERITLSGLAGAEVGGGPVDLIALDQALDGLRRKDERWARIVELRFFGGLTGDEVANALGLSRRTVTREWTLARAWLRKALG